MPLVGRTGATPNVSCTQEPPGDVLVLDRVSRVHGNGDAAVLALREVTLTVRAGEFVAVMGPSGSGKSTLLNLAGGLDRPTSGSVLVGGEPLQSVTTAALARIRRQKVGYVFQDFNLVPSLTALENVALPLELDGVRSRSAFVAAQASLESVGLGSLGHRFPYELSGGQQQRVAVARAVVGRRVLLLADEPTGALDSHAGGRLMSLLRERCNEGIAALVVTHDDRYAAWADRVVLLRDGASGDLVNYSPVANVPED